MSFAQGRAGSASPRPQSLPAPVLNPHFLSPHSSQQGSLFQVKNERGVVQLRHKGAKKEEQCCLMVLRWWCHVTYSGALEVARRDADLVLRWWCDPTPIWCSNRGATRRDLLQWIDVMRFAALTALCYLWRGGEGLGKKKRRRMAFQSSEKGKK